MREGKTVAQPRRGLSSVPAKFIFPGPGGQSGFVRRFGELALRALCNLRHLAPPSRPPRAPLAAPSCSTGGPPVRWFIIFVILSQFSLSLASSRYSRTIAAWSRRVRNVWATRPCYNTCYNIGTGEQALGSRGARSSAGRSRTWPSWSCSGQPERPRRTCMTWPQRQYDSIPARSRSHTNSAALRTTPSIS